MLKTVVVTKSIQSRHTFTQKEKSKNVIWSYFTLL